MATRAAGRRKEDFPTYSRLIRGKSQWVALEGFSLRLLKSEVQSFACEISPRGKLHKARNDFCTELSLSAYPACDFAPGCVPTEAICPGVLDALRACLL